MEILSDVLRAIRLGGALFFDVEAKATWVAETPAMPKIAHLVMPDAEHVIGFHAVLSGSCWAELGDGSAPAVHLSAGDVIILPSGVQHSLCSAPGMARNPTYRGTIVRRTGHCHLCCKWEAEMRLEAFASSAAISDAMQSRSTRCSTPCQTSSTRAVRPTAQGSDN